MGTFFPQEAVAGRKIREREGGRESERVREGGGEGGARQLLARGKFFFILNIQKAPLPLLHH